MDVFRRASALYDEVVVAVMHNPAKRGTFTVQERQDLLHQSLADLPNVRVKVFARTLLVDVCREVGAQAILKGLRSDTDFAYELPMALMNRQLTGIETVFLPAAPELGHLSSSLIREVASLGGDVSQMVPEPVLEPLLARVARRGDGGDDQRRQ
jgi:pantetheine-phosphate adenylyltransferase